MNTIALLSIGTRIKDLCPAIQHIDLYNNQYLPDAELQTNPFSKPAVFIEFGPTQWDDTNDGIQQGEGLLRVHVVLEVYADTYSLFTLTPEEQQTLLAHYQTAQTVHAALQDFAADGTATALQRINSIPDHDYDNIIIEVLEYHFRDVDTSAQPEYETATIRHVIADNEIIN